MKDIISNSVYRFGSQKENIINPERGSEGLTKSMDNNTSTLPRNQIPLYSSSKKDYALPLAKIVIFSFSNKKNPKELTNEELNYVLQTGSVPERILREKSQEPKKNELKLTSPSHSNLSQYLNAHHQLLARSSSANSSPHFSNFSTFRRSNNKNYAIPESILPKKPMNLKRVIVNEGENKSDAIQENNENVNILNVSELRKSKGKENRKIYIQLMEMQ